eukprot:gene14427-20433_t
MANASFIGKCVTSVHGTCRIDPPPSVGDNIVAVVTWRDNVVFLENLVLNRNSDASPYVGTIVLDRKLVKPGDSLHVTEPHVTSHCIVSVMWIVKFPTRASGIPGASSAIENGASAGIRYFVGVFCPSVSRPKASTGVKNSVQGVLSSLLT